MALQKLVKQQARVNSLCQFFELILGSRKGVLTNYCNASKDGATAIAFAAEHFSTPDANPAVRAEN